MSASQAQYIPFAQNTRQIRLLRILPETDLIQPTTRTFNLEESPDFVALSYEWKTNNDHEMSRLNGTPILIRRNLSEALIILRKFQSYRSERKLFRDDAPYFWIDAICINQADDPEKCHQVAMMGDIYHRASQTVAWLGPKTAETSLTFDYVRQIFGRDDRVPETEEEQEQLVMGVFDLCGRAYFRRVWIVQEIILSKKLYLVCGDSICSWDAFVKLCALWSPIWYSFPRYSMSDMLAELAELRDEMGGSDCENSPQEILASLVLTSRFR
jgi:hypothetical protein